MPPESGLDILTLARRAHAAAVSVTPQYELDELDEKRGLTRRGLSRAPGYEVTKKAPAGRPTGTKETKKGPTNPLGDPCVIAGCSEPIAAGDLVFCAGHRARVGNATRPWRYEENEESQGVSLAAVLERLAEIGACISGDGGPLVYEGPSLGRQPRLHRALWTFRDELLRLLTSDRLCVFCPRVLGDGEKTLCSEHRRQSDAEHMPWDAAAREGVVAR